MPYRNMSLDELARHLGMDAREVRRMAERGVMPGQMIGGEWRFNRMQMLDWLQREMHTLDAAQIQNIERAMADAPDAGIIGGLLAPEGVDLNLPARSKASVLRELAALAERTGLVYDREALIAALEEREAIDSTGLAGGLALPHPRRPLPYATAEPLICVARVPAGIPFGAPDRRLTDLFFLLCSHDERAHLHVLARLALLLNTDLPQRIREAEEPAAVLEMLLEAERKFLSRK